MITKVVKSIETLFGKAEGVPVQDDIVPLPTSIKSFIPLAVKTLWLVTLSYSNVNVSCDGATLINAHGGVFPGTIHDS